MTPLTTARVAVAAAGLVVWGYGSHVDNEPARWFGIVCFAIALLLRFLPQRR
ncbi:MAG: hypothetical protein NVS1B4_20050 [Gemmatimonadaceae bacterium]